MATAEAKNSELQAVLKAVVNILEDSQKGFADIGEHLKDETLKRYFLAESLKRANFRGRAGERAASARRGGRARDWYGGRGGPPRLG